MRDKRIIIIAIILAVIIIGYGWYYQKTHPKLPATVNQLEKAISKEKIEKAEGISNGKEDAPIIIEEYTNFLCPACANFAIYTLPLIEEKYIKTGQVRLIIYIFPPLELGQGSLCAEEQEGFLAYHNYLFSHPDEIRSAEDLKTIAEKTGLNKENFSQCLDSEKYKELVINWYQNGIARGVEATPTFYINDEQLIGAHPFEKFEEIIEAKLAQ